MAKNVEFVGLEDVDRMLGQLLPREANNLMRATVHGIAGEVAKDMKKRVPMREGVLKKAIKTKRRRAQPGQPRSDVIITSTKNAKHNAWYWRFVEYGTSGPNPSREQPFVRPARDTAQSNIGVLLRAQFGKKLESRLKRLKKAQSRN